MIGPCTIISQHFVTIGPHEYSAGMANARVDIHRLIDDQLQVLRCNQVDCINGFIEISRYDNRTLALQCLPDYRFTLHRWQQFFDRSQYLAGKLCRS